MCTENLNPDVVLRCGMEMRLVIEGEAGARECRPDKTLIVAIVRAHMWWRKLCNGHVRTIKDIAVREKSDEGIVRQT